MNLPFLKSKLFRQLPPLMAVRVSLAEAGCRILDPHRARTYAQTGEDRILFSLLGEWKSTFYVDVGCHHPIDASNTYLFYQMGWHGLCIDANPHLIREFARARPRDTAVCACVGANESTTQFLIADEPLLSHVVDAAKVHPDSDRGMAVEMPLTPLSKLMQRHGVPHRFGLLSIDVEGLDAEIVRSLDLNEWRPEVIVIEMHNLDLMHCDADPTIQHLSAMDYQLVVFSANNGFFIDHRGSAAVSRSEASQ